MKPTPLLRRFLAIAGSAALTISYAHAVVVTWDGDTSVTWADAANWDTLPTNNLTSDIANFNLATYDGITVFAPTAGTTSINGLTIGALNGAMTLTTTNLSIGGSGISIANGAGAFTISGALTLGAAQSWTNNDDSLFTVSGAVTNGTNLLTIGGAGNTTINGVIGNGAGGLTKNDAGILTLGAANTYTGLTTVNGGELRWGIANALSSGNLTINNGGTVNMQTFADTVGTVTLAQGGTISGSTGVLTTGASGLVINDGGAISGFSGVGGFTLGGNLSYNDVGTSTTATINRLYMGGAVSRTFTIADGDDASGIDLDITSYLGNTATNNFTLIKAGAGVMQLSGGATANTNWGTSSQILINEGTLLLNKNSGVDAITSTSNAADTIIGDGTGAAGSAILRLLNHNQIYYHSIEIKSDGLFDLNGFNETLESASTSTLTHSSGGSLTTGAGTLTLASPTNTISGASTVTGNLTFSGTAATNLTIGGTANINGTTTFSGGANGGITSTGTPTIQGTLALGTANRSIVVSSGTLAVSAQITGSTGTIAKTGAGTLTLSNSTNTYTGLTDVQVGTLAYGASDVIANGASVKVSGGILDISTFSDTVTGVQMTAGSISGTSGVLTSTTAFDMQAGTVSAILGGSVGLNKTTAGTVTLSGANTYSGNTTVSAGILLTTKAAALVGYNVASKVVINGGTLGVQVGGAGWTTGEVDTLLTNATKTSGSLGFDTTTGDLTQWTTFTTANLGLTLGLNKLGTGTLVLDQANTYIGNTTITGGILNANSTDALGSALNRLVFNGGTLQAAGTLTLPATRNVWMSGAGTIDTNSNAVSIAGIIYGTGALTKSGVGTLTLSTANYFSGTTTVSGGTIALGNTLALQNSAYNTASVAGGLDVTGFTTPTLGGLTGGVSLSTSLITGYDSITNLILNPSSNQTYTADVANNTANLSLTKTGAATQILQGANTYAGETKIIAGTLTLSGASGSIASTAINLTGGGLTLDNATNLGTRVGNTADITVNASSTLTFTHGAVASTAYAETIDTLTLAAGTLTYTGTQASSTGPGTSILTFNNALAQSGTGTANFTGTGLGTNGRNRILFTAQSAGDLGPWAVVNSADFATYNATEGIQAAANTTLAAGSNNSATNFKMTVAGVTITGGTNPSYKTLLVSDTSARTLALAGNTVSVGGISSTGQTHIISGAGAVQALTAGDALYINVGANTLTFSSVIQNVGAGATATTLVTSGGGQLTLGNSSNSYSGGTVLNGGIISTTLDGNFGLAQGSGGGGITVNGAATWNPNDASVYARSVTVNEGAVLSFTNGGSTSGALTGNGTVSMTTSDGFTFSNTGNLFTGTVNTGYALTFASLGDSSNPITIGNSSAGFTWTGGLKSFALRPFTLQAAGSGFIRSSGSGALTIQQSLAITGAAGARTLNLGGTYTSAANTFSGNITDGEGSVVSLTKGGDATIWALSGTNAYSGATNLSVGGGSSSAGLVFQGIQALSPYTSLNQIAAASTGQYGYLIKILDDSATPASRSAVNLNLTTSEGQGVADNRGGLKVFVGNNSVANGGTSSSTQTGSTIQLGDLSIAQTSTSPGTNVGGLALSGANGYKLQIGAVKITPHSSVVGNTNATLSANVDLIITGNVQQQAGATSANVNLRLDGTATGNLISGDILNSADGLSRALSLTKANIGTWTLSGTNSSYSGKSIIQNGTLSFTAGNVSATANQSLGTNTTVDLGVAATSSGRLLYTGAAGTLAKNINALGNGTDTIQNSGTGLLTLSGLITKNGTTLTLNGGSNGINITGGIAGTSFNSDLVIDSGTTTLSVASTYNGPTFIRSTTLAGTGILNANVANALPTSINRTAVTMDDSGLGGSQLNLGASQSIASLTGAASSLVNLNANTLTIGTASASTTFAGVISGSGGSLIKDGASTLTLTNTNTYDGTTTVTGGILRVDGSLSTGAVNVSAGALGGVGTVGGAVTASSTGGINLANGSVGGTPLTLSSTLDITGSAGANNLSFDLASAGSTTDKISVVGTSTVTTTGAAVINFVQLGGTANRIANGTYTLIGGAGTLDATNFAKFSLATTKAFGMSFALSNPVGDGGGDLAVTTTRETAATAAAFWAGGGNNWSTSGNWRSTVAGGGAVAGAPDYQTNVTFNTTTPGALNLTTNVLDTDFDINALNFANTAAVTIGGTKMLTLEATNANGNTAGRGITSTQTTVTSTISANVGLAASQTWSVVGTTQALGGLVVSGNVSDFGGGFSLTKIGAGTLTLSGNNSYSGGTTLSTGTLSVGSDTAIPSTGTLALNGGTIQSSGTARSFSNPVTIGGDFTVGGTGNMTFSNTGVTALGATRQITVSTSGVNATFAQSFSGAGFGITKAGAGTLTLTGNNSYTGTTTLSAGSLIVDGGTIVGGVAAIAAANTSLTIKNGGTVSGSGAASGTSGVSNVTMTVTGGSGVVSTWNINNQDLSAIGTNGTQNNIQLVIDGAGVIGSARVINVANLVWGRSTYNSAIQIKDGGQMNVSGEIRLGNPYYSTIGNNDITIGGTATSTLTGNGGALYIGYGERNLNKDNDVTVNSNGVLTGIGNVIIGHTNWGAVLGTATNNKLTVTGTGTASIANFSLGYVQNAANAANSNVVQVTNGGTLTTTSGTNYIGRAEAANSSNSNTATVTDTGSVWNASNQNIIVGFTNNAANTSNNNILTVELGGLLNNVGTLTVGSTTGTSTGNKVILNGAGTINATTITVNTGNTLQFGSGGTTSSLSQTGNITNNGSMVFNLSTAITQGTHFDDAFGGTGTVSQIGAGTTTFAGAVANTYSGLTTVTAGTLELNKTANLGTGGGAITGNTLINGGTLKLLASEQIINTATITQTSGTFNLNGKTETIVSYNKTGGTFLTGRGGSLIGTGATFTFDGAGTNVIEVDSSIVDGHVVVTNGATVDVYGANAPYDGGAPGTNGGILQVNSAGTGLEMNGTAGNTINLASDTNSTTAASLVLSGDLTTAGTGLNTIASTGGEITKGYVALGAAGSRIFTVADTVAGTATDLAVSAVITSTGAGLTKAGAGTLELTGTNTYTGPTNVTGGVLAVNGSLANTTTTVGTTATLQGSGSIGGSVTIQGGGTLAAGNSIQSLATGALSLEALATFAYEIDKSVDLTTAGDLTAVTGTLTIAPTATLTLTELDTLASGIWDNNEKLTLISYSGAWSGGLFDYAGANGGLGGALADDSTFTFNGVQWQFNYNDTVAGSNYIGDLTTPNYVTMTVIPEPRAALLGGIGMLLLLRRRRN